MTIFTIILTHLITKNMIASNQNMKKMRMNYYKLNNKSNIK